jgi:hypothetical protein
LTCYGDKEKMKSARKKRVVRTIVTAIAIVMPRSHGEIDSVRLYIFMLGTAATPWRLDYARNHITIIAEGRNLGSSLDQL